MSEVHKKKSHRNLDAARPVAKDKRAYKKPGFQHQKVFETMALACGKISSTQFTCRANRKNS